MSLELRKRSPNIIFLNSLFEEYPSIFASVELVAMNFCCGDKAYLKSPMPKLSDVEMFRWNVFFIALVIEYPEHL